MNIYCWHRFSDWALLPSRISGRACVVICSRDNFIHWKSELLTISTRMSPGDTPDRMCLLRMCHCTVVIQNEWQTWEKSLMYWKPTVFMGICVNASEYHGSSLSYHVTSPWQTGQLKWTHPQTTLWRSHATFWNVREYTVTCENQSKKYVEEGGVSEDAPSPHHKELTVAVTLL